MNVIIAATIWTGAARVHLVLSLRDPDAFHITGVPSAAATIDICLVAGAEDTPVDIVFVLDQWIHLAVRLLPPAYSPVLPIPRPLVLELRPKWSSG